MIGIGIQHERKQNTLIEQLQVQFSNHVAEIKANNFDSSVFSDVSYNYLAIGNSITKHSINEYWWNEIGMAASTEEKDYVHLVVNEINHNEKIKGAREKVSVMAINYSAWEIQGNDRAETYVFLDPYLSDKLDFITVQLGENVQDSKTFKEDLEELINHIKEKSPKAKVLIIGQFWADDMKDTIKKQVCEICEVDFVNLSNITGKKEYQAGIGTIVYDSAGKEHKIEHEGVALHPGDKGMEWIAKEIIKKLE